jgi:nitroreductase
MGLAFINPCNVSIKLLAVVPIMPLASVTETLERRSSCRAFTDQVVPQEVLDDLLGKAGMSPSGANVQPWQVHVLGPKKRAEMEEVINEKVAQGLFHSKTGESFDFRVYPGEATDELRGRQNACAEVMYGAAGIPREDKMGRMMQAMKNGVFFDAPVGIILTIDPSCVEGQLVDTGIFLQSLMLLAEEEGLSSCPQQFWGLWANTVREVLNINGLVVVGLSLGYGDKNAPINAARQPRLSLNEFVTTYE